MFLEDQIWPKRCGHMKGKQVIPVDEQLKNYAPRLRLEMIATSISLLEQTLARPSA